MLNHILYFNELPLPNFITRTFLCLAHCQITGHAFDILSTLTGRAYHITDCDAGSQMWIDLINAMGEKLSDDYRSAMGTTSEAV